ncbi:MAG TPA: UrcA family protein [Rhizomicrobium sp.]|nr:UrcA family protein [Rhizomicrobium sp.]
MFRAFTAASIFALTVSTSQAASAIDVQFRDLDLSRPSDTRVLQARVHQAADKACDPLRAYPTSLFYRIWFNNCVRTTSAETTRRIEAMAGRYRMLARN